MREQIQEFLPLYLRDKMDPEQAANLEGLLRAIYDSVDESDERSELLSAEFRDGLLQSIQDMKSIAEKQA